jgi:very-short-patch-repair endonuclease
VAIEVDGDVHDMGDRPMRDERRDAWVADQGVITLRFLAVDVLRNLEAVAMQIESVCASRAPPSTQKGPLHRLRRSPSPANAGEEI